MKREHDASEFLYIFLHIPKTGGQTLRDHFIKHLTLHDDFIHLGPLGENDAEAKGLAPFAQRDEATRRRARVIFGHNVYNGVHALVPGKEPRYVTFLRHPAERIVSDYNFQMEMRRRENRKEISFESFYRRGGKNYVIRWICNHFLGYGNNYVIRWISKLFLRMDSRGHSARKAFFMTDRALRKFWLVGSTDRLESCVAPLLSDLGIPTELERSNITGRDFPKTLHLSDKLRRMIEANNPWDIKLFRKWCAGD